MKKLLFVLAIGAFVASCNDSGTTEAPKGDTATTTPAVDTAAAKIDTAAAKIDTAAAKIDTAVKK
jgi:hypothetical protein